MGYSNLLSIEDFEIFLIPVGAFVLEKQEEKVGRFGEKFFSWRAGQARC